MDNLFSATSRLPEAKLTPVIRMVDIAIGVIARMRPRNLY